jgi:hypothetical protein
VQVARWSGFIDTQQAGVTQINTESRAALPPLLLLVKHKHTQVNQIIMNYTYSNITFDSVVIENLGLGDAKSAELARPLSVSSANNFWPLYYNRSQDRLLMKNNTMVFGSQVGQHVCRQANKEAGPPLREPHWGRQRRGGCCAPSSYLVHCLTGATCVGHSPAGCTLCQCVCLRCTRRAPADLSHLCACILRCCCCCCCCHRRTSITTCFGPRSTTRSCPTSKHKPSSSTKSYRSAQFALFLCAILHATMHAPLGDDYCGCMHAG